MTEYQVLARRYRPKTFKEVIGQEAIVTTLVNAIRHDRLAQAYLFCGSRGTGKTTLARVLAKALNCANRSAEGEPCCACSSCLEIASGSSLDVLEIDGASHRGIDDIRQINETVGYSSSCGKYKIYIIDEVHMLTKEAFNALLKTLEEPPPKVKFLFATTEPHKVLPTILSRCQRFNLNRISDQKIMDKLASIGKDMGVSIQEEALRLVANRADGGLRDAESLLDQIFAFHEGSITADVVASVLGVMPRDVLFDFDIAGKEGRLTFAFEIAHKVFSEGKDLLHFVESLVEHFRNILLVKLSGPGASFLSVSTAERARYAASADLYSREQIMTILDYLVDAQNKIRFMPSGRVALETILLYIMRTHHRIPVEALVRRLAELEQTLKKEETATPETPKPPAPAVTLKKEAPAPAIIPKKEALPQPVSMTVDPTPTPEDLGLKRPKPSPKKDVPPPPNSKPVVTEEKAIQQISASELKDQHHYDTLLQFAAVELEGKVEKMQIKRV